MPPCGVPHFVSRNSFFSITPARRNFHMVNYTLVLDTLPQYLHHPTMINRIEVGRNVSFDDPEVLLVFLGAPGDAFDGIHSAAVRSEAKGVETKFRLVDRLQDHP